MGMTPTEAHERLYNIYRTYFQEFGPVTVPESAEIAWLWVVAEGN